MSPPVQRVVSDEKLPASADIVVIGAGIAGSAAAYWLAKKGHSVVLLDKGNVGGEQSSRNWGWCRQQHRDLRELPLAMKSLEIWGDLNHELGRETGFRRTGLVYVTDNPADFAQWEDWTLKAREYQMHSHVLSAAEAKEMTPGSTGNWIGGVHSPSDGRAEPSLASPMFAEAARRLGATIHQNCAVRGLDMAAGKVAGVVTEQGTIRATSVLCAGGAWSSLFLRRHGLRLPQAGVRSTSFATPFVPDMVTKGGLSLPGVTIRRRLDGGYTVGLGGRGTVDLSFQGLLYAWQFLPTLKKRYQGVTFGVSRPFFDGPESFARWSFDEVSPFERQRTLDPAADPNLVHEGLTRLAEHYPVLKGLKVARSWGGLIDSTPDGIPVISAVDPMPGLYLSTGYTGHGFGIGPAAGRLAADIVAGDPPIVDPQPYRYKRMIDGTKLGAPGMM
ncbi:MAG: FAD-binding oxidoreductase [Reyranella sp.]|uniref:NAD(P)/FAD-dependent oxidoreductase n=1 Tax=Reyranella sp. TaxID=1929291 RepID=UPI001AD13FEC|nr:FAD-binding oxidoreductase [Reyranella sp.]MBN8750115.1 FAD-binding oxidoreductase [Variovorax sp.]MBR2817011.1 FAD-binding oxidoreductase [Reyranella sp.]